ncbi:MAG: hypothetical protein AB1516_11935 [Pseudomonadota bacterium]
MENSKVFTDESIEQIIADSDLSRFIKVFGLAYCAADLHRAVQNLIDALERVAKERIDFPKLLDASFVLTKIKHRLECLPSKDLGVKLVPEQGPLSCLMAYRRVNDSQKLDLALVLTAMYLGDYHPKTLIQILSKHVKRDPLEDLSFRPDVQVKHALERAKSQSEKVLDYLIEGSLRSSLDRLQAYHMRLHGDHDLQKKRVLLTHARFSQETLIAASTQIQEGAKQGDGPSICELLSLHINCPPKLTVALPCWPEPGAFHWLSVRESLIYTNRSLFMPKGRVEGDSNQQADEWYLAKPIAQALKNPLQHALTQKPDAKNLGELIGVSENDINREHPEITDLRNRLSIEGVHQCGDDVLAAFAFSDPRLLSRGPAYYRNIKQKDAARLFGSVLASFGIPTVSIEMSSERGFGSLAQVRIENVAKAWTALKTQVESSRPTKNAKWSELATFHNAFAIATAFMCSIALALRPTQSFPLKRCSIGADFVVFNDKDSHQVTEFVEVPFGQIVKAQLDFYIEHLEQLRGKARELECAEKIPNNIRKILEIGSSEPLLFRITRNGLSRLGSSHLSDALNLCGFNLPPNFGRHFVQSHLCNLKRVEINRLSRHGSIFQSSNNMGVDLSPEESATNVVRGTEDLLKQIGVLPLPGLQG